MNFFECPQRNEDFSNMALEFWNSTKNLLAFVFVVSINNSWVHYTNKINQTDEDVCGQNLAKQIEYLKSSLRIFFCHHWSVTSINILRTKLICDDIQLRISK